MSKSGADLLQLQKQFVHCRISYVLYDDWTEDNLYLEALTLLNTEELDIWSCFFWLVPEVYNYSFVSQAYKSR